MKQVETRYVVVRKSDNFFCLPGPSNYFVPIIGAAKFYVSRENAEKRLQTTWWWKDELHKDNYVIKEVTITYEVSEED